VPGDELKPPELWTINTRLKALEDNQKTASDQQRDILHILDGRGQEPGIRQQLRELRHYVEGNPPAVRGIIKELETLNASYLKIHADLNDRYEALQRDVTTRHNNLRTDFDAFVKAQTNANAKREGAWGGARLLWGLLSGAFIIAISILGLLVAIYNSTSAGGS
jgi:chromosome segregation ATPase